MAAPAAHCYFGATMAGPPEIKLVVNADGFGANPELDRGILKAYREGIVTSTSVLGNCTDPAAVKAALASAPGLGVGIQLTLIGGAPIANPGAVRSLLGPDERLPTHAYDLVLAWARGVLRADDVEREFDAQLGRLRETGLAIDHLDTRMHLGFLPAVGRVVEAVARRHGVPGIRMAVERPALAWVGEIPRALIATALGGLAWLTRRQLGVLRHGPQTWGFVESGHLDEIRILEILGRLGPGLHELICHPIEDGAGREVKALTSPLVRQAIAQRQIELCRWADLF